MEAILICFYHFHDPLGLIKFHKDRTYLLGNFSWEIFIQAILFRNVCRYLFIIIDQYLHYIWFLKNLKKIQGQKTEKKSEEKKLHISSNSFHLFLFLDVKIK